MSEETNAIEKEVIVENPNNTETVVNEKTVKKDILNSEERLSAIREDLAKRNMAIQLVIASDENGTFQVIGYDSNGTTTFISRKVDCVKLYSGEFDSGVMREIGAYSMPNREDEFWENKRKEKAQEEKYKLLKPKKKGFWGKLLK